MSKVRALIKKFGFSRQTEASCLEHTTKQTTLEKDLSDQFKLHRDSSIHEYSLNSRLNIYSTVEIELDMLFYRFNSIKDQCIKGRLDVFGLTEEHLIFINSCRISFTEGYFLGYTMKKADRRGVHLVPPPEYVVRNEDGSIDHHRSYRVETYSLWIDLMPVITFECPFPLYTMFELARLNPFFTRFDDAELQKIIHNYLEEKNLV